MYACGFMALWLYRLTLLPYYVILPLFSSGWHESASCGDTGVETRVETEKILEMHMSNEVTQLCNEIATKVLYLILFSALRPVCPRRMGNNGAIDSLFNQFEPSDPSIDP
jgi:hypothetical protein